MAGKHLMGRLSDALTMVTAAAALLVSGLVMRDRYWSQGTHAQERDRVIENWDEVKATGARIGLPTSPVTIVEFGDYECPACRSYEKNLRLVLEKHHGRVALVYRHWPLPQHSAAYYAARAAECARAQGSFSAFHRVLFDSTAWMSDPAVAMTRLANVAGVPDSAAFRACAADTNSVTSIEADIALARKLEAAGTPAIVVNGHMFGRPPDFSQLEAIIVRESERNAKTKLFE